MVLIYTILSNTEKLHLDLRGDRRVGYGRSKGWSLYRLIGKTTLQADKIDEPFPYLP